MFRIGGGETCLAPSPFSASILTSSVLYPPVGARLSGPLHHVQCIQNKKGGFPNRESASSYQKERPTRLLLPHHLNQRIHSAGIVGLSQPENGLLAHLEAGVRFPDLNEPGNAFIPGQL